MLRHGLIGVLMLAACGSPRAPETSHTAAVIAEDTMVEIEPDTPLPNEALRQDFAAIGRMTGGCTAFHIGEGVVATAGHCLDGLGAQPTVTSCYGIDITWGLLAEGGNAGRSRCLQVLAWEYDEQADYALIQVDPVPATAVALQNNPAAMKFNAQTMVVGYPKGKSLSLSGVCPGTIAALEGTQIFHHSCDTLPGNSGSPVMDAVTSKVIGVHNGDADNAMNYGSYLPKPENLLPMTHAAADPGPLAAHLEYGPFTDLLKKTLVNFSTRQAPFVSFHVSGDIEAGYDKLIIVDGQGRVREHTGKVAVDYKHLPTPVTVAMVTDYSGASQSVVLDQIRAE